MPTERNVGKLPLYPSADTSAEWSTVSAAIRNNAFFSACIEDERLLAALQKLVDKALDEGWGVGGFVDEALITLDEIATSPTTERDETFTDNYERLYDVERLRLIYMTQRSLSAGYRNFVDAFDSYSLYAYPAWEFFRRAGAKEEYKRQDHVDHEGDIRLKTDIAYWLDRNRAEIGGFGNPYGPWGFNSWMTTLEVGREQAEDLGLLARGDKLVGPSAFAEWNLPSALRQIGRAGVSDLPPKQQQNVIDRCKDAGIMVEKEENTLEVVPSSQPDDPLTKMETATFDEWLAREADRIANLTEEEVLNELLNEK